MFIFFEKIEGLFFLFSFFSILSQPHMKYFKNRTAKKQSFYHTTGAKVLGGLAYGMLGKVFCFFLIWDFFLYLLNIKNMCFFLLSLIITIPYGAVIAILYFQISENLFFVCVILSLKLSLCFERIRTWWIYNQNLVTLLYFDL